MNFGNNGGCGSARANVNVYSLPQNYVNVYMPSIEKEVFFVKQKKRKRKK
jgi:hypothetical protein